MANTKTSTEKAKIALDKLKKRYSLSAIVAELAIDGHKTSKSHLSRIGGGNKCKKCGFESGRECSKELADALQKLAKVTK